MALVDLVGFAWALRDKPVQRSQLLGWAPSADGTELVPPLLDHTVRGSLQRLLKARYALGPGSTTAGHAISLGGGRVEGRGLNCHLQGYLYEALLHTNCLTVNITHLLDYLLGKPGTARSSLSTLICCLICGKVLSRNVGPNIPFGEVGLYLLKMAFPWVVVKGLPEVQPGSRMGFMLRMGPVSNSIYHALTIQHEMAFTTCVLHCHRYADKLS